MAALGARKARARRRADPPPARALRAAGLAALRARQMVSGRSDAALGLRALLAARRQAAVARRGADRARRRRARSRARTMRGASPRRSPRSSASRPRACSRPTKTRSTGCWKKASFRSTSMSLDPKLFDAAARARMVRAFAARARHAGRLCAAAAPRRRRVGERNLGDAARATVSAAGRPAGRLAPAARRRCRTSSRPIIRSSRRPIRWPSAPPLPDPAHRRSPHEDGIVRTALAVEPRDGRLCVFMPLRRLAGGLRRGPRRGRGDRRATQDCRCTSKATRRRTIRASTSSRSRPIPA